MNFYYTVDSHRANLHVIYHFFLLTLSPYTFLKPAVLIIIYVSICFFAGESPWLYYANLRDIRRLRVGRRDMEIVVERTNNSIALDVDFNSSKIFWSDGVSQKINR